MRRAVLMAISNRLPGRIICHLGDVYLERFYVCTVCDLRVYLHRFVASDPDGVHNHPWRWSLSILLLGWYLEQLMRRGAMIVRKVRWLNWITRHTYHRVILPPGQECWSLFIHSPRRHTWGFVRPAGVTKTGRPMSTFVPHEATAPPPFSDWHLTAPKGRDLEGRKP